VVVEVKVFEDGSEVVSVFEELIVSRVLIDSLVVVGVIALFKVVDAVSVVVESVVDSFEVVLGITFEVVGIIILYEVVEVLEVLN